MPIDGRASYPRCLADSKRGNRIGALLDKKLARRFQNDRPGASHARIGAAAAPAVPTMSAMTVSHKNNCTTFCCEVDGNRI